jgi:RimJ/RimL family protein N-acetyltransferase
VILRPFASEHLESTRRWIADPRLADPFLFARDITPFAHGEWFERVAHDRSQCLFAIYDGGGLHIGNAGFKHLDRERRSGEIWIYLAPEQHGRGLGSMAVREAVSAGVRQLRLNKIYLHVSPENRAARRIYEKAGFRLAEASAQVVDFKGRKIAVDRMDLDHPADEVTSRRPSVALMQPMFLPWLGYFELMNAVDIFVFLDDFQFSRQGWGHRNRLFLSPGRPGILSLPIRHPKNLAATFLDIAPAADRRWYDKLNRSVNQSYGHAACFVDTWEVIGPKLRPMEGSLAEFEIGLITAMAALLDIRTQLRRSSEFGISGLGRSERLVALLDAVGAGTYYAARGSADYMREDGLFPLSRLPVLFQNFAPIPYQQSNAPEFVPFLSALDALFNLPCSDARQIMHGTRRWLPWDETTDHGLDGTSGGLDVEMA